MSGSCIPFLFKLGVRTCGCRVETVELMQAHELEPSVDITAEAEVGNICHSRR